MWVHGDITASNLLLADGALHAVIDFGCAAVGDPACDLVVAWTFFPARAAATFRRGLPADEVGPGPRLGAVESTHHPEWQ